MQNLFAHDELCGACSQQTISGRDARTPMLRCQLCPAVYHFPCAGYYDESGASIALLCASSLRLLFAMQR